MRSGNEDWNKNQETSKKGNQNWDDKGEKDKAQKITTPPQPKADNPDKDAPNLNK